MAYDLTNKTFGHLTAQKIIKQDTSKHNYWKWHVTDRRLFLFDSMA